MENNKKMIKKGANLLPIKTYIKIKKKQGQEAKNNQIIQEEAVFIKNVV